jgi:hypothetical protein
MVCVPSVLFVFVAWAVATVAPALEPAATPTAVTTDVLLVFYERWQKKSGGNIRRTGG